MASVYLSLGSNIGRETNLCACMKTLRTDFPDIVFSPVYETPAVGFDGEPFFNLVAKLETEASIEELQCYLRRLEDHHGRLRTEEKYSSRTLDADLLLYGNTNLQPTQNLPHNDILKYPFVLFPLLDIAPTLEHPALCCPLHTLANTGKLNRDTLTPITLTCPD